MTLPSERSGLRIGRSSRFVRSRKRSVIPPEQFVDEREILLEIGDEDGAGEDGVADRLGDFGFSAAGDGGGFVTERGVGTRPARRQRRPGGFSMWTL